MAVPNGVSRRDEESKRRDAQIELRQYLNDGFEELTMLVLQPDSNKDHRRIIALIQVMKNASNLIVGRDEPNASRSAPVRLQDDQHDGQRRRAPLSKSVRRDGGRKAG